MIRSAIFFGKVLLLLLLNVRSTIIIFTLCTGEGLYRTREQRNTLNPVWKESFILSLPKEDLSSLELRIEVMKCVAYKIYLFN